MYELFRYVVFTKSPFFQKNSRFFHHFPEKTTVFHRTHPKISVIFRKTASFFTKNPQNTFFRFFPKQAEIKTIFQPFNHTEDSIRAGPSGNAAGGEIRKNSAALLFS